MLRSLLAPDSPMSTSLADIEIKLRDHFDPKPSIIAERFKFHKRNQNASESVATYIAELRRLAVRCNFPRDYLEDTLRDRFVCGLRSEAIQKQLLVEKDLTMAIYSIRKGANLRDSAEKRSGVEGAGPFPCCRTGLQASARVAHRSVRPRPQLSLARCPESELSPLRWQRAHRTGL